MTIVLNIHQLAQVANLTRSQIDQWISRGYFQPETNPAVGEARAFSVDDAISLGALAEFSRLGIRPVIASMHVHVVRHLPGINVDDMLTITPNPAHPDYMGVSTGTVGEVVNAENLAKIATGPNARPVAAVNLSAIVRRVHAVIGNA